MSHMMASSGQVMQQSHSMPSGVDSTGLSASTPEHKKLARNLVSVKIKMLDESISVFHVQHKLLGKVLFEQVCQELHLLESDYFGIEYVDQNKTRYWLDPEKQMNRQIGLSLVDPMLIFCVKFYTPDPAQLEEPYTRYLFALQIKRDLAEGILQCNDNTSALMASFIIQAECGDFMEEDYPDHTYLSSTKFVPHQDIDMQLRIMEHYRKHRGQTPEVADLNLLEIARRCEVYGIKMSKAKDHEGVPLHLAVAHMGILVFQNFTKINTFSWAKIRKLSFKKKRFLIKLHPKNYGYYKDTVEFYFDSRNECKNFWKKCIEHHGFFRCPMVKRIPRQKTRVFSRGSSFRYSGKTQKEVIDYVRSNFIKRQPFQRSASFKMTRSVGRNAHPSMGRSISTHLPVSESDQNFAQHHNAASTPVSQSCGSVTLTDKSADDLSPSKELPLDTPAFNKRQSSSFKKIDKLPPAFEEPPPYVEVASEEISDLILDKPETIREVDEADAHQPEPVCQLEPTNETPVHETPEDEMQEEMLSIVSPEAPKNDRFVVPSPEEELKPVNIPPPPLPNIRIELNLNRVHYILKEILMTERTYKKDLEVLAVWFREAMNHSEDLLQYLFAQIEPIYKNEELFLRKLEERSSNWDERSPTDSKPETQKIGDIILEHLSNLKLYKTYATCYRDIIYQLPSVMEKNKLFEQTYKNFEMQKVCYLPLSVFILKPAMRLNQYLFFLEELLQCFPPEYHDYSDCKDAYELLKEYTHNSQDVLYNCENDAKLLELQRDLLGFDKLIQPKRKFLREGSLQKYSKKGFQQRIFFLFSDLLIYGNKVSTTSLQFKVHGHMPLSGVRVEETESKLVADHCFTVYGMSQALLLAASTESQKIKWINDITTAVNMAQDFNEYVNSSHFYSSDDINNIQKSMHDGDTKQNVQRSNTTVQVCWHRNTTVGIDDLLSASRNHLSGFLLRKFKSSNGWQKLWVVFTNFCLFFYKSYQNDFPLASLPLLGYTVSLPHPSDAVKKEFVFKLQFKYHVYFFRAENEYFFNRWMTILSSATINSEHSTDSSFREDDSY